MKHPCASICVLSCLSCCHHVKRDAITLKWSAPMLMVSVMQKKQRTLSASDCCCGSPGPAVVIAIVEVASQLQAH